MQTLVRPTSPLGPLVEGFLAIEVKAASTVRSEDIRGLRHLADRLGDDFLVGEALHTGDRTLRFGPRMLAVPIAAIWEAGPD